MPHDPNDPERCPACGARHPEWSDGPTTSMAAMVAERVAKLTAKSNGRPETIEDAIEALGGALADWAGDNDVYVSLATALRSLRAARNKAKKGLARS
jgi:hypothetical protein